MCDLIYFGEHCAPGIIIWDILNKRDKLLFMLGSFEFDNILSFLKDRNFDLIYNLNYLENSKNNNIKPNIKSILNQNIHFDNELYDNCIVHSKYKFKFLHDYIYLHQENSILNYEYIVNQYKLKIKNTISIFNNNNPVLFLNFLYNNETNFSIINNINEMLNVLKSYMNHKKFYLLFFTNFEIPNINYDNVFFIKLLNNYDDWYLKKNINRFPLYNEIYSKFYDITKNLNLNHNFPIFEETFYYKNNINNNYETCGVFDN